MTYLTINENELLKMLEAHEHWLRTSNIAKDNVEDSQLLLKQIKISDMFFKKRNFSASELYHCHILRTYFQECDFSYALLISCVFEGCTFLNCSFVKTDLRSANCVRVNFEGSDFTRADLTEAIFIRANLSDCIFNWAWLLKTDLRHANLNNIHLENARLIEANVFNTERFQLNSLKNIMVKNIYTSPEGGGEPQSGLDALSFLRKTGDAH
jgi:uncharacterized protein YjbI with pentapeptide repeats